MLVERGIEKHLGIAASVEPEHADVAVGSRRIRLLPESGDGPIGGERAEDTIGTILERHDLGASVPRLRVDVERQNFLPVPELNDGHEILSRVWIRNLQDQAASFRSSSSFASRSC